MAVGSEERHFVLVHGACHGAWCWYKIKPLIEAAGHRVTVLDMSASGINPRKLDDVLTMYDYSQPLMELMASIPAGDDEKVILVGHSLGGYNLSLAMEQYPRKISVAVFLTAFMPDTVHNPAYVLQKFYEGMTAAESWLDTQFEPYGSPEQLATSMFFGPQFLLHRLYQLSPIQDYTLARTLARVSSLFVEDLAKAKKLTEERYGSVKRVYVVCDKDKGIPEEFQRWMIKNAGVTETEEIKGSDHMPMFSKPEALSRCLLEIASRH